MFRDLITDEKDLRALLGSPSEVALKKQIPRLDEHCRAFIAHAPFVALATADGAGRCDVSPKGDPAGFVRVIDDTHLVVPDRPGNKRLDGLRNILANPHVALLFLVPERGETLRVNGRACITRDPALLELCVAQGKAPALAIGVEVEEVFLHCAKAFKRSGLWEPARWPEISGLVSSAKIFHDQVKIPGMTVEDYERRLATGYKTGLY